MRARTVVIASGARYRRLDLANVSQFEGGSVHYWASPIEARLCEGQEIALVGAGNSAGQAAVYLAGQVEKVWLLVRGASLAASMSKYLIERIEAQPNIEVVLRTEVTGLHGGENLTDVSWRESGHRRRNLRRIRHLFLLVGADPNTDWLAGCGVALDQKGFVRTGVGEDRPSSGDKSSRNVRDRRRSRRLNQARSVSRRRRRAGRCRYSRIFGEGALTKAPAREATGVVRMSPRGAYRKAEDYSDIGRRYGGIARVAHGLAISDETGVRNRDLMTA